MRQQVRDRKSRIGKRGVYFDHAKSTYGMEPWVFELMLKSQNGYCAICQLPFEGQQINVDHCHSTGKVRGLLCSGCNRGLGSFQDRSEVLRRAADYLDKGKT